MQIAQVIPFECFDVPSIAWSAPAWPGLARLITLSAHKSLEQQKKMPLKIIYIIKFSQMVPSTPKHAKRFPFSINCNTRQRQPKNPSPTTDKWDTREQQQQQQQSGVGNGLGRTGNGQLATGICVTVSGQNAHKKPIQSQLNQLNWMTKQGSNTGQ